jgi:hypothetical protein
MNSVFSKIQTQYGAAYNEPNRQERYIRFIEFEVPGLKDFDGQLSLWRSDWSDRGRCRRCRRWDMYISLITC